MEGIGLFVTLVGGLFWLTRRFAAPFVLRKGVVELIRHWSPKTQQEMRHKAKLKH
jgi:hypothetical protein